MDADLAIAPGLDLAAMAQVVEDLLQGGADRRRDAGRLRGRVAATGLDRHAGEALEALRRKLCAGEPLRATDRPGSTW
jgi:hypothetical protein